jgi:TorA maturation chaperone TorD
MARARARASAFLSDVLARGVHLGNLDEARRWPELGDVLEAEPDLDALAVRYEQTLGRNSFPFEAVFLDPEAQLGGVASRRVQDTLSKIGYLWDPAGPSPDHLAVELAALGFVSGAEAFALEDGDAQRSEEAREDARQLLENHLLAWLLPFAEAVEEHGDPLFVRVIDLVQALVVDHARHAGVQPCRLGRRPFEVAPELSRLVEDPSTDLGRIIDHLLTPNACGAFWSVDRIVRLGRGRRLPGGFGTRRQRLRTLMATAADCDRADVVVADLRRELERADARLRRRCDADPELLGAAARPWRERLRRSLEGLDQVARMLADHQTRPVTRSAGRPPRPRRGYRR